MRAPCCVSPRTATKAVAVFYIISSLIGLVYGVFLFISTSAAYVTLVKNLEHNYYHHFNLTNQIGDNDSNNSSEVEFPVEDDSETTTAFPELASVSNITLHNGPSFEALHPAMLFNQLSLHFITILLVIFQLVLSIQLWKGAQEENYWRCNSWYQTKLVMFIVSMILVGVIIFITVPLMEGTLIFAIVVAISCIFAGYPLWIVKGYMKELNHDEKMSYSP